LIFAVSYLFTCSITGIPYGNTKFEHKEWKVPSKVNIAVVRTKTGKKVVLKLTEVKPDYERELSFLECLNKNKMTSKFVVELKESIETIEGSNERRYCIVMEELGVNLHDYLEDHPELDHPTCIVLALNLIKAVQAVHRAGVIHGDLKPHQLCFTRQPGIALKLVDFDSACTVNEPLFWKRFTPMYAAPEVVRAAAKGAPSSFVPTKGVDLWPLGLMLAQIFHSDFKPIFCNDEEAQVVLQGNDPMLYIDKCVINLRESIRQSVSKLLSINAEERWSASQVLNEDAFRTGTHTMMMHVKQGQEKIQQGQEELLASQVKLQKAAEATQRMIFEHGKTPVPRMAMLVPVDLETKDQSNVKELFGRLASAANIFKYYDLYLLCEGCTLFPNTACSCGSELKNPVRVEIPGTTLKKLAPVLKGAAMFYKAVSFASNIAGVHLPFELPGVNDLVVFTEGVSMFVEFVVEASASPISTSAEDHGQEASRAYGPAYATLVELLEQSGVVPKDNTCHGLHKVTYKDDGKEYWVCKTHAETHTNLVISDFEVDNKPHHVPEEEEATAVDVATTSTTEIATTLASAKQKVNAQEIEICKLWTEGNFAAAMRKASEYVKALEAYAEVSDEWVQFTAKAAAQAREIAAKGFQGKPKIELNNIKRIIECEGGCGVKLSSYSTSFWGVPKRNCMVCGRVVCAACSPPPKLHVEGYSRLQHVCKMCVEALDHEV